jgi:hypothetical protein
MLFGQSIRRMNRMPADSRLEADSGVKVGKGHRCSTLVSLSAVPTTENCGQAVRSLSAKRSRFLTVVWAPSAGFGWHIGSANLSREPQHADGM